MRENMRLNEMIESMETNCSTFISERQGIVQVEVDMYKDELMGNLQEKLIQKLGEMVLCINKAGEAYHIAECHHLRGHFSSLKRYRSCRECYGRAVRAVIRFVETRQHRQLVKHGEICARMTVQINSHLPTIAGPTWSERNRTQFLFSECIESWLPVQSAKLEDGVEGRWETGRFCCIECPNYVNLD